MTAMHSDGWRGEVTIYRSSTNTRPIQMTSDLSWVALMDALAPAAGPIRAEDKHRLPFFTPGLLRADVPLIGKTLERARERGEPEIGAMRSAGHMTSATFVIFEFDGLTLAQFAAVGAAVLGKGRAGLMYTTHSHGRKDKQGIRVRLVIPVNVRLDANAYRIAHEAMNDVLFEGLADPTGKSLCQQQAVFGAHPERAHLAKCWRYEGMVFDLEKFLAQHPATANQTRHRAVAQHSAPPGMTTNDIPTLERLEQAAHFLNADSYRAWSVGLQAFKALSPYLPADKLRAMAVKFGETSPEDSTRAQAAATDARYDPGQVFDAASPIMPPSAAAGVLLGMAKQRAVALVEATRGCRAASAEARGAATYLAAHHWRVWNELTGKTGGVR